MFVSLFLSSGFGFWFWQVPLLRVRVALTGYACFEYSAAPRELRLAAIVRRFCTAEVAELVDALASGASGLMVVEVQVLFSAPELYTTLLPSIG